MKVEVREAMLTIKVNYSPTELAQVLADHARQHTNANGTARVHVEHTANGLHKATVVFEEIINAKDNSDRQEQLPDSDPSALRVDLKDFIFRFGH